MQTQLERYAAKVLLTTAISMSIVACSKPVDTAANVPSTTAGTEIDDTVVTASVRAALLADPDVKSLEVKVETRKGEVQLSGFVSDLKQVERISAIVKGVQGVKTIDNKLEMKPGHTTVGNQVDDAVVSTRVKAALLADAHVKSFDIGVETLKGEVQLSGFVDSQDQIDRAVKLAGAVDGVHSVNNQMSLKK